MAALKSILKKIYSRIPGIRELLQIQDLLLDLSSTYRNAEAAKAWLADCQSNPRYTDPLRLLTYSFQVCSQNREDGIINEIFRRIKDTNKTFVEIGVGDGTENNTAFLLTQGWTGFWIDGNPGFLRNLEIRPDLKGGCLKGISVLVTKENICHYLAELKVPIEFDLLSLDIDQNTYYIWEALGHYRPRVVVVEYNASIPPGVCWKSIYSAARVWDKSHNFGASLKAYEQLGRHLGYELVGCEYIGANAFFVRRDLVSDQFAAPFTAENHYEPPRYYLAHRKGHPTSILDRQP